MKTSIVAKTHIRSLSVLIMLGLSGTGCKYFEKSHDGNGPNTAAPPSNSSASTSSADNSARPGNLQQSDPGLGNVSIGVNLPRPDLPINSLRPPVNLATSKLTVGGIRSCLASSTGQLKCWGDNTRGDLGNGNRNPVIGPIAVNSGNLAGGVSSVALGTTISCAVTKTPVGLTCWGSNPQVLGPYTGLTPRALPGYTDPKAVVAGMSHMCVLSATEKVQCFGVNNAMQLAQPYPQLTGSFNPVLINITEVKALFAGGIATAAIKADGKVYMWGREVPPNMAPAVVPFSTSARAVSVAIGLQHLCALFDDGNIHCFGDNSKGQFGTGTTTVRNGSTSPVIGLTAGQKFVDVAAAGDYTCGVLNDRTVRCWGANANKNLDWSNSSQPFYTTPITIAGLANVISIGLGDTFGCAMSLGNMVTCFGYGPKGELGSAFTGAPTLAPVMFGP